MGRKMEKEAIVYISAIPRTGLRYAENIEEMTTLVEPGDR